MSDNVRLGLVGSGTMGQWAHLANYAELDGVDLVVLAEGRAELAQRVATRYGIQETCANHTELAARDDLDAVVAILPFQLHYGVVRELLASGKHVATEKALCLTEPAGQALVEAAAAAGKIYQVCYMKRFDPAVVRARELIAGLRASGEAGELREARIWCCHGDWTWQMAPPLRTTEPLPAYPAEPEPAQPGATPEQTAWATSWLNYYSHQTNLVRYLVGEDYQPAYHDHWSGGDLVVAHTPDGVRIVLEFTTYRVPGWDEGFELRFERAVVNGRLPAPLARQQSGELELLYAGQQPRVERPYTAPIWAMKAQAEAFIETVRSGGATLSPAAEAFKEVELAWGLCRQMEW